MHCIHFILYPRPKTMYFSDSLLKKFPLGLVQFIDAILHVYGWFVTHTCTVFFLLAQNSCWCTVSWHQGCLPSVHCTTHAHYAIWQTWICWTAYTQLSQLSNALTPHDHLLFWQEKKLAAFHSTTSAGHTTTHWDNFRTVATDVSDEYDNVCVYAHTKYIVAALASV